MIKAGDLGASSTQKASSSKRRFFSNLSSLRLACASSSAMCMELDEARMGLDGNSTIRGAIGVNGEKDDEPI